MKKLLGFLDKHLLKIGISFLFGFIALYPKLPSIYIHHTWVYIRLEDFFIALIVLIWGTQLLRKKVKFGFVGIPIFLYWIAGFLSFAYSIFVLGPQLSNFFPAVAALSYIRRIEYMILFFVAFSSIKTKDDLRDYLKIIIITVSGVVLYGLGQKFYVVIWQAFPAIFNKITYCFPSFQTGNEEFAKGIPLCLPFDGRITSTFAGHYDLAAYMVIIIPIFIAIIFTVKKTLNRILLTLLTGLSAVILVLTASRISFIAYVLAGILSFIFIKRKKFILPFLIFSFIILIAFSQSTARRFLQTFRLASVVTNSQGQVVGEDLSSLTAEQRAKLAHDSLILGNIVNQNLPAGSGFIGLPKTRQSVSTNSALVRSSISIEEAKRLQLENGGVEISTIKGNFLIQKAFVYDISFTTRFQAEWPNAIRAFSINPLIGSGYSTITLATDNDFLRFLGESGIVGLLSFLSIFMVFATVTKKLLPQVTDTRTKFFILGLWAGVCGLFINAGLIDVFESSKVAETLWILMGFAMGTLYLYSKNKINYVKEIKSLLVTPLAFMAYLTIAVFGFFSSTLSNFFVADDFTWLKWAANSTLQDLGKNFVDAGGFFYRPIDKAIIFFLYTFFALQPAGYHIFIIFVHLLTGIGVFLLSRRIFKDKYKALIAAILFLFLPSQGENIFWFATISTTVATLFIVYSIYSFIRLRQDKSVIFYPISLIFATVALFTYELSVVTLPLVILTDFILLKAKITKKILISYIPFIAIDVIYLLIRFHSNVAPVGGSYSYSIVHLIPNIVGNFIGYWALFIFGEKSLPIYTIARNSLKGDTLIVIPFVILAVAILMLVLFATKERVMKLISQENPRIALFGLCFSFFALITFIPLGNIAERYSYLSSVGFVIFAVVLIYFLASKIYGLLGKRVKVNYIIVFLIFLISAFYITQLNNEKREWLNASKITQRSLAYFRLYHESLSEGSNIYFANIPIRREQAWIFPTGLADGLWFIYRDPTLTTNTYLTLQEALNAKNGLTPEQAKKTFIFYFDKNDKMQEVK